MNKKNLTYYCFDFDDNLLHMDTKIYIERYIKNKWVKKKISTFEFAKIRLNTNNKWRLPNNNESEAFIEFSDIGTRLDNAFYEDTIDALKNNKYAPSWYKFIECLTEGNIFAIITARGHEPKTIRKVIKFIIDNELNDTQKNKMLNNLLSYISRFIKGHEINKPYTFEELIEEYLDNCDFYGVSSEHFKQYIDINASNPEEAKEIALKMFTERVHKFGKKIKAKVHIGFSDDDKNNIETIKKLFKNELSIKFRKINFNIYDTSNPKIKDGVRTKINH